MAFTVYQLSCGYDDGYEKWETYYDNTIFVDRDDAERARQFLLDRDMASDSGDYHCVVRPVKVVENIEDLLEKWEREH
jgi:hypothetical protein